MNNSVLATIEKFQMLKSGDSVITALSGGADSVCLISILNSIKEQYNLKIYAAHLNHSLRGEEAERDEKFCKILCKNFNIQLFTKKLDIRSMAMEQKISEELCGRNARYEFFDELSKRLNAKVATAHTASDNAETVLFNLTRGSGINGAGGISPVRGNIIRPLIELCRADIEDYCSKNKLEFVTDSSNLENEYTRNKIRHLVVPTLKEINPQFERSVLSFSQTAGEINRYLNSQAEKLLEEAGTSYGYDVKILLNNEKILVTTAVSLLCKKLTGISLEHNHINLIYSILSVGGSLELSKEFTVTVTQGILRVKRTDEKSDKLFIEAYDSTSFEYNEKTYELSIDNSLLENKNLVFRNRLSGDSFAVPRRKITKQLRKLMTEYKIPSEIRERLVVLAEGSKILWCEQIGVSEDGQKYKTEIKIKGGKNNA